MSGAKFITSVVGSMPRSQFVRDLVEVGTEERLGTEEHRRRMDAACAYIIALQESTGIDEVTDGEWRRRSYIGIIADICDGFELTKRGGQHWTTVTGRLRLRRPGLIAREVAFTRQHARRRVKATLPSPYLLGQRMWDPAASASAYPTREAFMGDLVAVLREELRAVRDAGADVAQIDDPHLCLFVDPAVRAQYANPDREADLCVRLINGVLDGVTGIQTAVHLCRRNKARAGWVGQGGYEPIIPQLRQLQVRQYVLEFTIPAAGDLSVLRALPDDRGIGLGCVDCRGEHVDTVEEIVARVEKAIAHVDAERVSLNPDCGFAPGSAAEIPIDEAYSKLCNEARAAAVLREKYA
ncbi:MAG: cobalamin-independent methionine synthase II family protein [Planctomycetes bacterium]|nr:cobalamin-independent methionine synthase II family protein [Planctomycetota bacterium]